MVIAVLSLELSLVQGYVLETLNERDYFRRKATFSVQSHFPTLIRQRPHGFFFRLRVLKENRPETRLIRASLFWLRLDGLIFPNDFQSKSFFICMNKKIKCLS